MSEFIQLWMVQMTLEEDGVDVVLTEGPWDRNLAESVIADIGVDASIAHGLGRVNVKEAILVPFIVVAEPEEVEFTPREVGRLQFLRWRTRQPGFEP